jgi:uncharacterized protein (TIGR02588 family)
VSDNKSEKKTEKTRQGTSLLEWCVAAVGGLLFIAMIGYMAIEGLETGDGPPQIEIVASPPVQKGSIYIIGFEARNVGDQTAAGVVVRATLSQGGQDVETSEVTVDYLPSGSTRSGGFFFAHDPSAYEVQVRPVGYLDP